MQPIFLLLFGLDMAIQYGSIGDRFDLMLFMTWGDAKISAYTH